MGWVTGSQGAGSIVVAVGLLVSAAAVFPGIAFTVAGETSGRVDDLARSFPAATALARIEADGHLPGEARRLLQDRLPQGSGRPNEASGSEMVPSARLQNDRIDVRGSLAYIESVHQRLIQIEAFGLRRLLYKIVVVEVPSDKAKAIIETWDLMGGRSHVSQAANADKLPENAIAPASFNASTKTIEFRVSRGLSEGQIGELVDSGKLIRSPEIVGDNGAEVVVRVGSDVPFVATYEPVQDENGGTAMQPVLGTIRDGITLRLTGTFADREETVCLELGFTDAKLEGMGDPFMFKTVAGPLPVQQPEFASTGFWTPWKVSTDQTVAVCSEKVRESVVERGVPLMGRIPYVGKFFKFNSKTTESITTIVLLRCQEYDAACPPRRKAQPDV